MSIRKYTDAESKPEVIEPEEERDTQQSDEDENTAEEK